MNFFRKIFGLGPKEPTNVIPKNKPSQINPQEKTSNGETDINFDSQKIYPILVSEQMTEEFTLDGELCAVFYDRENIFSRLVISHFLIGDVDDKDGTADSFQLRTFDKTEEEYNTIFKMAKENFENFEKPFVDWNIADKKLNFRVLSCGVSYYSSQKIMSKKHMLEAHKMLDAEEILVSIPRRGLIFVCSSDLNEEDYSKFLNIHGSIVMQENTELEYLCEDLFILKNGEITRTIQVNELTELLKQKYQVE